MLFGDADHSAFPDDAVRKKQLIFLIQRAAIFFRPVIFELNLIVTGKDDERSKKMDSVGRHGNVSCQFDILSIQDRLGDEDGKACATYHIWRRNLRCGDMYLDGEVSGVGFVFCLQRCGAEQEAEYGNELFHFTFPRGLKPTLIVQHLWRV